MLPRELPLGRRARLGDLLAGKARLVGSRTDIGRDDLGLASGVVSPYEARIAMGLKYGDPVIEEARYERTRSVKSDVGTLLRWALAHVATSTRRPIEANGEPRPYVVSARVDALETGRAIDRVLSWLADDRGGTVYFVHPHALNLAARDATFRAEIARADLVLPDGIGLRMAAGILGTPLPANVNGTDLVPELLVELAVERVPVVLVGGAPGVAAAAGAVWKKQTGVEIAGAWDGFGDDAANRAMVETIRAMGKCVVLVAMGSPHQERFVGTYLADLPRTVSVTVGGLFDFASGSKQRAPMAWRELGLEWVWRLVHEPRRLGKRYLVGNPEFLLRAAAQRVIPPVRRRSS